MRKYVEFYGKLWFRHPVHGWLFDEAAEQNTLQIKQRRYLQLFLESDAFHCPCCGHVMAGGMTSRGHPGYKHRRTRGHLHPRQGWPRSKPRPWIWQCSKCNQDQGGRSLWHWAMALVRTRDPRAEAVVALADKFLEHKDVE